MGAIEAVGIGSRVGQYRLTREVGQGGMGVVYEAIHDEIGRRAAIKVLSPRWSDDPRYVRRFLNEARTISRVHHPGLVQVYDFGQTASGEPYILMELLEGETLRSRLARRALRGDPPSAGEVRRAVRQIAAALAAIHHDGIVHCDLKPDNVMLVADEEAPGGERAKLLDFGIARFLRPDGAMLAEPGVALGTAAYMSPEQCAGDEVDAAADVYALGVLLYELLAGAPPFCGPTGSDVMRQHVVTEPPALAATTPPDLVSLAARMLAKEPARRPSMQDVVDALAEPHSQRARRRRAIRLTAILVAAASIAVLPARRVFLAADAAIRDGSPEPGAQRPAPGHGGQTRLAMPINPVAAGHYVRGLEQLRTTQAAAAIESLRAAVSVEPRFAPAYMALADAYWYVGRETEARAAARQAVELAERRAPTERLLAQARVHQTAGEPERAAEIYERLWHDDPEELEYGLQLSRMYEHAGDAAALRRVLREVMRIPAAAEDPRVDLLQIRIAFEDGDRELTWTLVERLLDTARARGIAPYVPLALEWRSVLLWSKGRYEPAVAAARESVRLSVEVGDRHETSWMAHFLGRIELDRGRVAAAQAAFAAIDTQGLETRGMLALQLDGLGRAAFARGDLPAARRLLEQALAAAERAEGRSNSRSGPLYALGALELAAGDLEEARRKLEEAAAIMRAKQWRNGIAECETLLAAVDAEAGDPGRARVRLGEALAIWQERQAPVEQMRVRLELARLDLRDGEPAEAEAIARQAAAWFAEHELGDDRALAEVLLVESLLAQGRRDQAAAAVPSDRTTERLAVRLALAWAAARPSGDRIRLVALAEEAHRRGHRLFARRVRAVLGETRPLALAVQR